MRLRLRPGGPPDFSRQVMAIPQEITETSAARFRIKEEWNFVAECRRKGIPQAAYCKNGFIDTSVRLLDKIERNSLARQSAVSKEREKRSSEFVFELTGQHWKVSPCVSVPTARRGSLQRCGRRLLLG